jgi:hypothetical protein
MLTIVELLPADFSSTAQVSRSEMSRCFASHAKHETGLRLETKRRLIQKEIRAKKFYNRMLEFKEQERFQ